MNYTLFDPTTIFISAASWNNPEKRDKFLEHLIDNLDFIDKYKFLKIYWTLDLDCLLHSSSTSVPWMSDNLYKNQLIPIIYKKFNPNIEYILLEDKNKECQINLDYADIEKAIINTFSGLAHKIITLNANPTILLGIPNHIIEHVLCECDCHPDKLNLRFIKNLCQWLDHFDFVNIFWPNGKQDLEKFSNLVKLMNLKYPEIKDLHDLFTFDSKFLDDLSKSPKQMREDILDKICFRLSLNPLEAAANTSLRDEKLKGKSDEFRFRVTPRPTSTRIHYKYLDSKIHFLRYYGIGEHDTGI